MKKKLLSTLAVFILLLSSTVALLAGGGIFGFAKNLEKKSDDSNSITSDDTTSYVSVGEIWNSKGRVFIPETLEKLLSYLTGKDISTVDTITSTFNAAQIRNATYGGKEAGKDLIVTLAGKRFEVVYLSPNDDGDPVVTLWEANNSAVSKWSVGSETSFNVKYPLSMYSTSYIRAVTLNNGGEYAINNSTLEAATQDSENPYAPYTMGELTKYIVVPAKMPYMAQLDSKTFLNDTYSTPNDSTQVLTSPNWSTSNGGAENIANHPKYFDWINDKIWLPSLAEAGYYNSTRVGVWKTSAEQRKNSAYYSWVRSVASGNAYTCYCLKGDGSGYYHYSIEASGGVRPALHLNLKEAALNAVDDTWDLYAASSYDSGSGTAVSPYIIKTAEQLAKLAKDSRTSNMSGVFFKLGADIDLSEHAWYRLDTFNGIFTGDFHTITGMHTVYINEDYRSGLFGDLGGVIDSLILTNGTVFAYSDGGAIANVMSDTAVISNCIVDNVDIMDMGQYQDSSLGGIATFGPGTIKNCVYRNGSIVSSNTNTAVAGIKAGMTGGEITNCVVQNVTLKNDDGVVSGICADVRSGSVNACFSEANIASKGKVERQKTIIGTSSDFSDFFYNANLNGGYPIPKTLLSLGSVDIPSATIYNALISKGFKTA